MDALRHELDALWLAPEHDHVREGQIYAEMRALIPLCDNGGVDGVPRAESAAERRAYSRKYWHWRGKKKRAARRAALLGMYGVGS
jgi:hypothetical protein